MWKVLMFTSSICPILGQSDDVYGFAIFLCRSLSHVCFWLALRGSWKMESWWTWLHCWTSFLNNSYYSLYFTIGCLQQTRLSKTCVDPITRRQTWGFSLQEVDDTCPFFHFFFLFCGNVCRSLIGLKGDNQCILVMASKKKKSPCILV